MRLEQSVRWVDLWIRRSFHNIPIFDSIYKVGYALGKKNQTPIFSSLKPPRFIAPWFPLFGVHKVTCRMYVIRLDRMYLLDSSFDRYLNFKLFLFIEYNRKTLVGSHVLVSSKTQRNAPQDWALTAWCFPRSMPIANAGGLHWGRHVCSSRAPHPRDAGGFRDVGG